MTIRLPVASRNAAADAIAARTDAGAGSGLVRVYTGSQPASADLAATGTLLAAFTTNDPAFAAAGSGTATLDVTPALSTVGVAAGDAGWFRVVDSTGATVIDSTGATVIDGSVSASGGGGDLIMSTITVSVGLTLQLTAGTMTMPAS
jgi:cytoskeletal protein RodZ